MGNTSSQLAAGTQPAAPIPAEHPAQTTRDKLAGSSSGSEIAVHSPRSKSIRTMEPTQSDQPIKKRKRESDGEGRKKKRKVGRGRPRDPSLLKPELPEQDNLQDDTSGEQHHDVPQWQAINSPGRAKRIAANQPPTANEEGTMQQHNEDTLARDVFITEVAEVPTGKSVKSAAKAADEGFQPVVKKRRKKKMASFSPLAIQDEATAKATNQREVANEISETRGERTGDQTFGCTDHANLADRPVKPAEPARGRHKRGFAIQSTKPVPVAQHELATPDSQPQLVQPLDETGAQPKPEVQKNVIEVLKPIMPLLRKAKKMTERNIPDRNKRQANLLTCLDKIGKHITETLIKDDVEGTHGVVWYTWDTVNQYWPQKMTTDKLRFIYKMMTERAIRREKDDFQTSRSSPRQQASRSASASVRQPTLSPPDSPRILPQKPRDESLPDVLGGLSNPSKNAFSNKAAAHLRESFENDRDFEIDEYIWREITKTGASFRKLCRRLEADGFVFEESVLRALMEDETTRRSQEDGVEAWLGGVASPTTAAATAAEPVEPVVEEDDEIEVAGNDGADDHAPAADEDDQGRDLVPENEQANGNDGANDDAAADDDEDQASDFVPEDQQLDQEELARKRTSKVFPTQKSEPDSTRELNIDRPHAVSLPNPLDHGPAAGPFTDEERAAADDIFDYTRQELDWNCQDLRHQHLDWTNMPVEYKDNLASVFVNRTKTAIRKFCRRRYIEREHGAWTEAEDKLLEKLHAEEGDKWQEVADRIDKYPDGTMRTAQQCRDRWRDIVQYREKVKNGTAEERETGPWSCEEEKELVGAVWECIDMIRASKQKAGEEADDEEALAGFVAWKTVSEKLKGSRSAKRCREKWDQLRRRLGGSLPTFDDAKDAGVVDEDIHEDRDDAHLDRQPAAIAAAAFDPNTKAQRAVAAKWALCDSGDIYDVLVEISTAIPDKNKVFELETTLWSAVAMKNPESRFPGALRRRAFFEALETYGGKTAVKAQSTIAGKAAAMVEHLDRWVEKGKGKRELKRGFRPPPAVKKHVARKPAAVELPMENVPKGNGEKKDGVNARRKRSREELEVEEVTERQPAAKKAKVKASAKKAKLFKSPEKVQDSSEEDTWEGAAQRDEEQRNATNAVRSARPKRTVRRLGVQEPEVPVTQQQQPPVEKTADNELDDATSVASLDAWRANRGPRASLMERLRGAR